MFRMLHTNRSFVQLPSFLINMTSILGISEKRKECRTLTARRRGELEGLMRREPAIIEGMEQHGNSLAGRKAETETGTAAVAPRRRWPQRVAIALVVLVVAAVLAAAAFFAYVGDFYHDLDAASHDLASTEALPVQQGESYLAFGDPAAETGIVLYPGAKVEYTAYAPLMRELAERGYLAVVVEMPFNLAFFDINAADSVRSAFPQVKTWWVGGHSLGGSMAAQYAADHSDDAALGGIVLLGAYSASDLSATDLGALVVYGENDEVVNRDKLSEGEALLPPDAQTVKIAGGNHAGFGTYGPQDGDGEASIAPEEQREQTADAVDAYLEARAA